MSFDLNGLGNLVRVFRESKLMSQQTLASQINPPTNRSAIAHLEQGLRAPATGVLQALCEHLEIPRPLWERFVLKADSFRAGTLSRGAGNGPKYIAIAGMIGSGKTTLARGLANILGYRYLPEDVSAKNYIDDLIKEPSRWAFETQLAFLISKALSLQDALSKNIPLMLDRSLTEDIEIFAEHFRSRQEISERSFTIYNSIAQHFITTLPPPDLLIYCQCEFETVRTRVASRHRADLSLHSDEYLASIHKLYEHWVNSYSASTLCTVKSEEQDWRSEKTIQTIVREIDTLWWSRTTAAAQLDLFGISSPSIKDTTQITEILQLKIDRRPDPQPQDIAILSSTISVLPYPSCYIAAPFTAAEEPSLAKESKDLFGPQHGRIPRKRYRRALESLDATLRGIGLHTTLPHRDINAWGATQLTPAQVAASCSQQVAASDIFVGILALSHGSHYEFGVARGLNKPAILIDCKEMRTSFIGKGFRSDDRLLVVETPSIASIASRISQNDVIEFLGQYIPITQKIQ